MPEPSAESPSARLTRFVLESSRLSAGRVNHRAFLPPPDLQLSTFNITDLASSDIWVIGEVVRSEQMKERLYGRADLLAESVYAVDLRAVRDDRPLRHVLIVGWPTEKAQQKNKAQLLAAASAFVDRWSQEAGP